MRSTRTAASGNPGRSGLGLVSWLQILTVVIVLLAVGIRGVAGKPRQLPNRDRGPGALAEPLQLLMSSSDQRVSEIAPRLELRYRDDWIDGCQIPFLMHTCPELTEWLPSAEGQQIERLIGELRRGGKEEAFASLIVLFQLARATQWQPGLLARTHNAERMAQYFQDWLAAWAEKGVEDPLLFEPVIAATLAYSRVMRSAYDAPALGYADAPYERAREFMEGLTGAREIHLTAYGEALSAFDPAAFREFLERDDFLRGFEKRALVRFPELDGECGR